MTLEKQMSWEKLADHVFKKLNPKVIKNSEEKEFKEWFMERKKVGYRLDYLMVGRLFLANKLRLQKQRDYFVVIVGLEGSGKTTFGCQLCAWTDPHNFSINQMCFERYEIYKNLRILKPGSSLQIDEGGLTLFSRESMSVEGRNIIKILMTVRRKRLLIVTCCPSYKDLDKYVREHRISLLIDVRDNGTYTAYFGEALQFINTQIYNKKKISACVVPNQYFWQGWFSIKFPKTISEEEYLQKKDIHIEDFLKKMEETDKEEEFDKLVPAHKTARAIGMTSVGIVKMIKRGDVVGKRIGRLWYIPIQEYNKLINMGGNKNGNTRNG